MASGVPTDQALNAALKKHLLKINADKVIVSTLEARSNLTIVEETVNSLITAMKEVDELFKDLYQRPVYTGSYWDGLRVKSPTEFDLNMVLRLPFVEKDVEIITLPDAPAFLQFHLKREPTNILAFNNTKWSFHQKIVGFFDEQRYLLRPKVHRWIHSVITRARSSPHFQKPTNVASIAPSSSGPAFTYFITTTTGAKIDMDLVPVIDGCYPTPKKITKSPRFNQLLLVHQFWFLVPKPYTATSKRNQGRPKGGASPKFFAHNPANPRTGSARNPDTFWRISFPEAEKQLLPSDGCVKMLIKLFKLLRDEKQWKKIASYYIKTLFLLELDNSPNVNWHQDQLGSLFMMMLGKFKTALEMDKLSYYFNRDANLLSGVDPATKINIAREIGKIINEISATPQKVIELYKTN